MVLESHNCQRLAVVNNRINCKIHRMLLTNLGVESQEEENAHSREHGNPWLGLWSTNKHENLHPFS